MYEVRELETALMPWRVWYVAEAGGVVHHDLIAGFQHKRLADAYVATLNAASIVEERLG